MTATTMASSKRPVRIAGCSGSATDRRDAMALLAANHSNDPLDVIIGDWMSEANMTSRGVGKAEEPDAPAYEPTFLESLELALPDISRHKIKLVVNAGASDTQRLHDVVTKMVDKDKLDIKVAWISGDEALPAIKEALKAGQEFKNNYTGEKLASWAFEPLYAQAYLGGLGIAAALKEGADIVLCGRVSDASLTIGSAAWWHGWNRAHLDELANSLIAGHLIECSSYVTGGNFSGFQRYRASWDNIGYPIAEIAGNGDVIMTKNQGSGGEMSVDTCTAQLLYEIQGPWYFNSDVTAIIDEISFSSAGEDRVALHGVKGSPPPPTTKVGITARGGFQAELRWLLVGLDTEAKAEMLEKQIRQLLEPYEDHFTVLEFTVNGSSPDNPSSQNKATVDVRVFAQARKAEHLAPSCFARPGLDAVMSAYPGATPHFDLRTAFPKPIYEYYVTLIPQSSLTHTAHIPWSSNKSIVIPPPTTTKTYSPRQPNFPNTSSPSSTKARVSVRGGLTDAAGGWAELAPRQGLRTLREVFGTWGRTVRGPLGKLVHARSGDKGSDCNVGFWVSSGAGRRRDKAEADEQYEWLRNLLSSRGMRDLLGDEYCWNEPEARAAQSRQARDARLEEKISRHEFPGIRAVHFVLHGHLDRGVSCTRSLDFLGKNVAEFCRARWVDLPVKFLEAEKSRARAREGGGRSKL